MSLSETSESASLRFNKDVHITETPTTMSPLKAEVEGNACNHNPHLDERLKLPDPTPDTANNSGNMNGSLGKSSMCFEPVNGFPYNVNSSEGENCAQSLSNNCASEVNAQQTLRQRSDSDCVVSDLSSLNTPSERDVLIAECGGAKQTVESIAPINDNCVEKLREHLDNTSLIENFPVKEEDIIDGITYVVYESEQQMPDIMRLITKDLSEPYSIYTYRYFIHNWPKLCFLAMDKDVCIGAIVCKLDVHKKMVRRGYIAMLAVDSAYRRRKLGSTLVTKAIQAMIRDDCDEVVLETEITNQAALRLYENLGFVRDKRLFRYYLNGVDALRLKLWLR